MWMGEGVSTQGGTSKESELEFGSSRKAVMRNSLELGNHSANPEQTQALKVTMETGAHRGIQGVGWVGGRMDRWAMDG